MISVGTLFSVVAWLDGCDLEADERAFIALGFALVCGVIAWCILNWTRDGGEKLREAQGKILELIEDPSGKLQPRGADGEPKGTMSSAEQVKAVTRLAETVARLAPSPAPLFVALAVMTLAATVAMAAILA